MPFINLKTNAKVSKSAEESIKSSFGDAITLIPGKSEDWLMVGIEPEYKLWFKGTDQPAAFVDIAVFGQPDKEAYANLTKKVCEILSAELSIPTDRTYVKYLESTNWGWNNMNF